jgi:hypothetical protein
MTTSHNARRGLLLSALAYIALMALMGRGVLAAVGTSIAGGPGDPLLTASVLTWNATHVPWTDAWYQFPIFDPTPDALTFSEHLLGVSVIAAPVRWLTGNSVATYNVVMLLSYPLCGIAMFALVWRLTKDAPAAFLAGLAYAYAPYRATHVGHIQVLVSFWMPIALLALHAYGETRRRGWLALFAASWALQGAANGYFLVYFTLVAGLWVAWFFAARGRWRDVGAVVIALVAGALPLVPILYRYIEAQRALGLTRTVGEISFFSADIAAVLCASADLRFWGWLRAACAGEGELFPGATLTVLCVAGVAWVLRARVTAGWLRMFVPGATTSGFYLLCAALCWALSWGPTPRLFGDAISFPGPYAWLLQLPGMAALRVPARLWMMTVLCLTVFMGIAISRLLAGRSVRVTTLVVAAVACGLIADGFATIRTATVPAAATAGLHGKRVLFLPAGEVYPDIAAGYHAAESGFRTPNGYSGYEPPHYDALRTLSNAADERLLVPFLRRGDLYVVVAAGNTALQAMVERQPGVEFVAGGAQRLYRVPARGAPDPQTPPAGVRLRLAAVSSPCMPEQLSALTDTNLRTRWECGTRLRNQSITLRLDPPGPVGGVVQAFGSAGGGFPRQLRIETSMDGERWATAWEGNPAADVFDAALSSPRDIRLVTPFSPHAARYVRLQQLGPNDFAAWSIAELEVWSGRR